MLSYVLPTRDRPAELARTLSRIGMLDHDGHAAEVIVVDNASRARVTAPRRLANGVTVRLVRLNENRSTAARNVGAREAAGQWIAMLDDDSSPLCGRGVIEAARNADPDTAAIGAEIFLPRNHSRESAATRESG
ncbi:MAG: glycosyltransferase family 2 protein, partial [Phycisphaerales bacterium]|nr:glycosyltransferase family 2 protein [Phycisphaerales bacterium]